MTTCHWLRSAAEGYWFIKDVLPTLRMYQSNMKYISINHLKAYIYSRAKFVFMRMRERERETHPLSPRMMTLRSTRRRDAIEIPNFAALNCGQNQGESGALLFFFRREEKQNFELNACVAVEYATWRCLFSLIIISRHGHERVRGRVLQSPYPSPGLKFTVQ